MLTYGFVIYDHEDKCIYNKQNNNEGVIICLYVYDLLIFGTSHNVVHDIKCFLASKFDMKILVEVNVILGIMIALYYHNLIMWRKKKLNTLICDLCLLCMT